MLNENIKAIRKAKGLSQQELSVKINVVRQTISKWEQGLSVPDSDMLVALSEVLDTPVSILLGETVADIQKDNLKVISEKLEVINLQLVQQNIARRKMLHWCFVLLCAVAVGGLAAMIALNGSYLEWDYSDPETAIAATALHAFEWLFVRMAPFILVGGLVGSFMTRRKE